MGTVPLLLVAFLECGRSSDVVLDPEGANLGDCPSKREQYLQSSWNLQDGQAGWPHGCRLCVWRGEAEGCGCVRISIFPAAGSAERNCL